MDNIICTGINKASNGETHYTILMQHKEQIKEHEFKEETVREMLEDNKISNLSIDINNNIIFSSNEKNCKYSLPRNIKPKFNALNVTDMTLGKQKEFKIKLIKDKYTLDKYGEIALTEYLGDSKIVNIPFGVERIEEYAFDRKQMITVSIPDTVKELKYHSFNVCDIQSVIIPKSVNRVGAECFCSCHKLKNVAFINSNTALGPSLFAFCSELNKVYLPNRLKRIPMFMFNNCESLKEISIPDSVEVIENYAFNHCESLKEISIPDSVVSIGDFCFAACKELKVIKFGKGIKSVGKEAFIYCYNIKEIHVPNEEVAHNIEYEAFKYYNNAVEIHVPNKEVAHSIKSIESVVNRGLKIVIDREEV